MKTECKAVTSVSTPATNTAVVTTLPTSQVPISVLRQYSSPKPLQIANPPKKA